METQQDTFLTTCWYGSILTSPNQVIAEFFDADTINNYRKIIQKALLLSGKHNSAKAVEELLLIFKMLQSLLIAASIICNEKQPCPVNIPEKELWNTNLYCDSKIKSS